VSNQLRKSLAPQCSRVYLPYSAVHKMLWVTHAMAASASQPLLPTFAQLAQLRWISTPQRFGHKLCDVVDIDREVVRDLRDLDAKVAPNVQWQVAKLAVVTCSVRRAYQRSILLHTWVICRGPAAEHAPVVTVMLEMRVCSLSALVRLSSQESSQGGILQPYASIS
jgi:hypothetical protein